MSASERERSTSRFFATTVLEAFDDAHLATDADVAVAGGPSSTTMTKLRKAAAGELIMTEPRADTFRRIDSAAGWEAGSARRLWRERRPPRPRRGGLAEVLGQPRPQVTYGGIDSFFNEVLDRITELEERLDLIGLKRVETAGPGDLVLTDAEGNEFVVELKVRKASRASERSTRDPDAEEDPVIAQDRAYHEAEVAAAARRTGRKSTGQLAREEQDQGDG